MLRPWHPSGPQMMFRGTNLMTPEWLGYFKLARGYAELSSGRGIEGEAIYGVTVRPQEAGGSQLFYSKSAALEYIEELTGGEA